ncbi:solute carrier organic anion transporter family member 74D isoform X1 [Penaeus vannamei]|uniref:solute carrier organic anion transporter family member 74D isoform X1 n=1 Tax=Penaeus vannamei TaxID=6689 RepID=UPI00387F6BF2
MAPNNDNGNNIGNSSVEERTQDETASLTRDTQGRRRASDVLSKELEEEVLGPVEDTLCGLGSLKGGFLQQLAHPGTYLVISSVVALVQGMFFTYSNATLSTIEKRFRLPSKVSGFVTTGNDVIQLLLSIHITFVAGRGHRPRWLALGMFCAALGCLLAVIPHIVFGAGDLPIQPLTASQSVTRDSLLCQARNSSDTSCEEGKKAIGVEQATVVTLHLMAQMLAGFASMLYYTVGYSYLDEAVSKKKVPLFLAVSGSLRILGPVCGYSLAGWSLSYWVDPASPPDIPPRHPSWIGAWWIGYLVIGSALLVITWSLLLLPRMLPGARRRVLYTLRNAAMKGKDSLYEVIKTLRPAKRTKGQGGIWSSVKRILTNKIYMLIIANQVLFWFAFFGYITFKPKYLEHQFKMSAAKANQYIAGAAMAATLVGWLGTGSALTFFRPRAKVVIIFMAALSLTNCILHLCMVNISCDHSTIHGMDMVIQIGDESPSRGVIVESTKNDSCSSGCDCSPKFSPVCVDGMKNFYNPCFAGCTSSSKRNGTKVYEDCKCAVDTLMPSYTFIHQQTAQKSDTGEKVLDKVEPSVKDGYCQHDCPTFYMYLALTVLTKMTHAASRVPVNLILFRCVEERDKDVGLGVFNAAIAMGASIPAPIIFGWAIDYSCRLWENSCGQQGFCWLYDLDSYRSILHGIPAALMACCLLTEIFLLTQHKKIHFYGEEEEENSDKISSADATAEETTALNSEAC